MGKALAAALLVGVAVMAAGCAPGAVAGAHAKRVVIVNPPGAGPVDAAGLAQRIAREDGASVSGMDVDVLSPDAVHAASQRIVAQRPALVIAPSADMVFGLRAETGTIPILFVTFTDPVQSSLVADEHRPHGNVSGFTFHVAIGPKQLELLLRAFPSIRTVGVVGDRGLFGSTSFRLLDEAAHDPLGVAIVRVHFESVADLHRALAAPAAQSVDAWVVPESSAAYRDAREVVRLVGATGKPAIYGAERFVRLGGLMSYSPAYEDPADRVCAMARSVLEGYPVGDLPVEHPQAFRLAVNTTTWARFTPPPPRRLLMLATDFYPDALP
jgi:putative ABC transport system substrate-binding protein